MGWRISKCLRPGDAPAATLDHGHWWLSPPSIRGMTFAATADVSGRTVHAGGRWQPPSLRRVLRIEDAAAASISLLPVILRISSCNAIAEGIAGAVKQ